MTSHITTPFISAFRYLVSFWLPGKKARQANKRYFLHDRLARELGMKNPVGRR